MEQVFTVNCRALTLILLFVTLNTGQANSDNYKKVGDTLVLSPDSVDAPITSITWKHNSNLAVEWYGDTIDFYPKFKGRCKLNTATGRLTFSGVTLEDSGSYTPEINNRVLNPIEIKVISEVPTPTVSESCEKTHCVLTCEGITTDAEPVVYSWLSGNMTKSETKELRITKEEKEPSFICKMVNPVSSESSKEVLNPFITSPEDSGNNDNGLHWSLIVFLVLVAVVIAGVIGVFIYKHITGEYPPLLLRVRSRFETFPCWHTADSPQTSPIILPEKKPLLNGKKEVGQGSSNLETINETEKPANQEAPADPPPSAPSSGANDQSEGEEQSHKEVSIEANNELEKPANQEAPADPPPSGPSSGSSGQPETTSEKSGDTEAAGDPSPSAPSSGSSDQPEGEEQPSKEVSIEANNEPETTPENQGPPPAKPPRSSSSSDVQVTSTQDQKTDESTGNINGTAANPSEKSEVVKSPPDLEKTTETPNREALNSNMEEKQENEN